MSNNYQFNQKENQNFKSNTPDPNEKSIQDSKEEQNLQKQQQLLDQHKASQNYKSIQKIDSSSEQEQKSTNENQKLLEQNIKSKAYESIPQLSSSSLQSQNQVPGNALIIQSDNCNYQSIQQQFSQGNDLSINHQMQPIYTNNLLKKCQQAFCYILEAMINQELQTPKRPIQFDMELQDYHQLRQKLINDDLIIMQKQEKELLQFFQGWFSFEKEIEKIQQQFYGNQIIQNQDLNMDYSNDIDFEIECLKKLKKYIFSMKQKELATLKELSLEKNTLNNLKKIKDQLNINQIQIFAMLCAIQEKDQKNKFVYSYIKWWFDWYQTSVFIQTKEKYQ